MEELLAYTTAQSFINDAYWKVLGQGGFAKEVKGLLWQLGIKATETFIDDETHISTDDILIIGIGEPALKKKFAENILV